MTVTQQPIIESTQNYLTNVGAMSGSGSSYGTFDQSGGVWELIDTGGTDGTSAGVILVVAFNEQGQRALTQTTS